MSSALTRYTVDLQHLQTVCAFNYAQFRRLLPSLERGSYRFIWAQNEASQAVLAVKVLAQSVYTDTVRVTQILPLGVNQQRWGASIEMELRLYHDAAMAEVLSFQSSRRIYAKNRYPNPAMHARDEKTQINEFLGECLSQCLQEGYADWPLPVGLTGGIRSAV